MLPGNLQYWEPCIDPVCNKDGGTKNFKIVEPIHFAGPSPGAPETDKSSTQEEVKQAATSVQPEVQQIEEVK